MADDKREKPGLVAKWRERRAHRGEPTAETAEQAARKAQEAEESARLKLARDTARSQGGPGAGL